MEMNAGRKVWIRCDVKPGPFSDERLVRVIAGAQPWVGFVPVGYLRENIESGSTWVQISVSEVRGGDILAYVPGHPLGSTALRINESNVSQLDAVQA